MEQSRVAGTSTTVFKANITKHTVSHAMHFDESIWNRHEKNPEKKAYVELENLASPLFTADDDGEVFFQIRLTKPSEIKSATPGPNETVYRVNINLESKPLPITLHFSSYVSDLETPEFRKETNAYFNVTVPPNTQKSLCYFRAGFVAKAGAQGFRVDTTYLKVTHQVYSTTPINVVQPKRCLGTDLLKNSAFSDLTLKAVGQEWKLHKNVLCARSDVFAAMFASDMKEATDGVVEIKNVDTKALDLMIKFIYTDAIDDIDAMDQSTTEELLILADKYNLPVLKEKCERRLISTLSVGNCLRVCDFASRYNSELLLTSSKKIVAENLEKIGTSQTDDFKDFVRNNPDLLIDLLRIKLSNIK